VGCKHLLTFPNQEAIYKIDSRNVTTLFLLPSNTYLEPVVSPRPLSSSRSSILYPPPISPSEVVVTPRRPSTFFTTSLKV
jgi:hypothetical protein